jgi:hypothetical protein
MRVSVLTWEYPPRIVSELSTYTHVLSQALAEKGFEVHVVTFHDTLRGDEKEPSGVIVHRVGNPVSTHVNVLTWDLTLSCEFERVCANVYYDSGRIDLIDCHEWLSVVAATTLRRAFRIPFVMSLDSLEEQRSNFGNEPLNLAIRSIERTGTHEALSVLVKSEAMKAEVEKLHGLNSEKVKVVRREDNLNGLEQLYEEAARTGDDG